MAAGLPKMAMAIMMISVSLGVGAQAVVHHVVGGDSGWEPSSDVAAWSSGRTFRVGDKIWFAYSAAQEGIIELESKEEYEACDVTNPIRMYTDGIDGISLVEEGIRYFVSTKTESCKNGLRIPVMVLPNEKTHQVANYEAEALALALDAADPPEDPPSVLSASARISGGSLLILLGGLWIRYVVV